MHWFYSLNANSILEPTHATNSATALRLFVYKYKASNDFTLLAIPTAGKGGICSNHANFTTGRLTQAKSLNTGIVTLQNYQKRIPPLVSKLTFAHELGHNFGSQVI